MKVKETTGGSLLYVIVENAELITLTVLLVKKTLSLNCGRTLKWFDFDVEDFGQKNTVQSHKR